MKVHFKTTKGKRLRIPSRTNHRRYIVHHSRLFTLAANNIPQNSSINTSGIHLSRRTYVPLFLQTVENKTSSTCPLLNLSTQKHNRLYGFTRPFDLNLKVHFKTTRVKRLRILSRTNLRRYFPPFTAFQPSRNQ